jgi:hypothetical protein
MITRGPLPPPWNYLIELSRQEAWNDAYPEWKFKIKTQTGMTIARFKSLRRLTTVHTSE